MRTGRRVTALVGAQRGHQTVATLARLRTFADSVVAVQTRHPRSLPAEELAATLRAAGIPARAGAHSVGGTVRRLMAAARADTLLLATGSLSVAAEVREELLAGIRVDHYPES